MPRRVYHREMVQPAAGQMQIHQAVRAQMLKSKLSGASISKDTNFARLRMIASGFATYDTQDSEKVEIKFESAPKLDAMVKRLKVDIAMGHKVIIVHEFVYSGKMLVERLRKEKIRHVFVHRGLKVSERREAKKKFAAPRCSVMIMNWRLGGAALDFPFANWMYFYETPVGTRYREQCELRIRRGNSVHAESHYVDFVTLGSVEESVLDFLKEGKDLRQTLLSKQTSNKQLGLFE
jgi:SNF2 family DNA or RNA helicase